MNEVTAIIVGRKGSQRIPNKVIQPFGDTTLLELKIKQLQSCKMIDRVVVGSDGSDILDVAGDVGAETVTRPDYFCDEKQASANEMIGNMCSLIDTDIVVWAHCTNPLLSSDTYDEFVRVFLEKEKEGYDSVLSVDVVKEHLWGEDRTPLNYDPYGERHPLAKTLPALYKQNGGIFIQRHKDMKNNSYFFGSNPYIHVSPEEESIDINTWYDFSIAEFLYEETKKENK
jgi:CMP-N,N'-diacetyllegionaminic acid synthase